MSESAGLLPTRRRRIVTVRLKRRDPDRRPRLSELLAQANALSAANRRGKGGAGA
ncbi:hypothetical protein [Streptomyces harbinensis]|uniref:hypothetical protein n=1 Tax=Streptomyces harbinensis TaxID=1176198 RepID=UPI0034DE9181